MKALKLKFDGKGEVSMNLGGCWVNQFETDVAIMSGDKVAAQSIHNLLNKHVEFVPYENMGSREADYYQATQQLNAALMTTNKHDLTAVQAMVNNCPYLELVVVN
jgi:D-aminopeptidase